MTNGDRFVQELWYRENDSDQTPLAIYIFRMCSSPAPVSGGLAPACAHAHLDSQDLIVVAHDDLAPSERNACPAL